jgi:ribose/xylose/arabinose/galactoside ABC-type transport system permease subunit
LSLHPIDDRPASSARPVSFRRILGWGWTVFGPFIGLVLITALFAWMTRHSGQFLSAENWQTIAVQTVIVGTAALGMTLIMIAGGIDLSVGSTVALVTVCMALFMKKMDPLLPETLRAWKLAMPAAMLLGVGLGGLCGAVNGALISGLRVVPSSSPWGRTRFIAGWPPGWHRGRRSTSRRS